MGPNNPRLLVHAEGWPDTSRLNPILGLDATPAALVLLWYCSGVAPKELRRVFDGVSKGLRREYGYFAEFLAAVARRRDPDAPVGKGNRGNLFPNRVDSAKLHPLMTPNIGPL